MGRRSLILAFWRYLTYQKVARIKFVELENNPKMETTKSTRDGSRTTATSKMDLFVIIVNGFHPLTIITKCSILDVAAVLDPPLQTTFTYFVVNCFSRSFGHIQQNRHAIKFFYSRAKVKSNILYVDGWCASFNNLSFCIKILISYYTVNNFSCKQCFIEGRTLS